VSELGLSYLRGIGDGSGTNENGSSTGQRSLRQEVGEDTESTLTSGIVDDDLLTVGVDVRVVTDLVSHGVTEVGGRLVSGDVAETGLAEFILRMEFAEDGRWNGDRGSMMNNRQRGRQSVNSWKMMNNRKRSGQRSRKSVNNRQRCVNNRQRSRKSVDDRSNVTDRDRCNVLDDLSGSRVRASVGTAALAVQSSVTSLGLSDSGKVGNFSFVNFGSIDDDSRSN